MSENRFDYQALANEIGALVNEKNKAYGNSFEQAEEFLKLLFPNGIPIESYSDMLCIVRIFDKPKGLHKEGCIWRKSLSRFGWLWTFGSCQRHEEKRIRRNRLR